jgi:hypothetical protein
MQSKLLSLKITNIEVTTPSYLAVPQNTTLTQTLDIEETTGRDTGRRHDHWVPRSSGYKIPPISP